MKLSASSSCALTLTLCVACSAGGSGATDSRGASGAAGAATNAGGSTSAGGAGTSGGTAGSVNANGGATNGGSAGSSNGGAGGASGAAGTGGTAGASATGFKCPVGPYNATLPANTAASRVLGAPPSDMFNLNGFTNVEGPVWIGDSLYFSEMTNSNMKPPARILKLAPGGTVTVAVADSGSNGLAVDSTGILTAAKHGDGSVSQIALPSGAATVLVNMYMGKPFNSPNDLTIRSDGTIYFSDPNYQNAANPQGAERLYWVTPAPTRTVTAVTSGAPSRPNGVTLSPDEKTLYVTGGGFKKFPVMTDGSLGASSDFVVGSDGDGMTVDCAGNVYAAGGPMGNGVRVYSPAGAAMGTITIDGGGITTNVAFGGVDHKTLYITAQGVEGQRGVFSIALNVPGYPY
jgi:gluconolactonase